MQVHMRICEFFPLLTALATWANCKGFSIGSAALLSPALIEASVNRAQISTVEVINSKVFLGPKRWSYVALLVSWHDNKKCGQIIIPLSR
jgi:hypothetical protein